MFHHYTKSMAQLLRLGCLQCPSIHANTSIMNGKFDNPQYNIDHQDIYYKVGIKIEMYIAFKAM
jgi:hypothetical protein